MSIINSLNKDILCLLINNYFHPREALLCLSLCKQFRNLVKDKQEIVYNYLVYLNYEDNKDYIEDIRSRHCKKCNQIMKNKNTFNKHIQKCKYRENQTKSKIPPPCKYCGLEYLADHKNCRARIDECCINKYFSIQPHAEFLKMFKFPSENNKTNQSSRAAKEFKNNCDMPNGYRIKIDKHQCKIQCKLCDKIIVFSPNQYHRETSMTTINAFIYSHILDCPQIKKGINKYNLIKPEFYNGKISNIYCFNCDKSDCGCCCLCGDLYAKKIMTEEGPIYRCFNCVTCGKCGRNLDEELQYDDNFVWDYGELPICHACYKHLNNF